MPELNEQDIREILRTDHRRLVLGVALLTRSLPAAEEAVQEALGTLSPRQRQVTVLRYRPDLDVREIARILSIDERDR